MSKSRTKRVAMLNELRGIASKTSKCKTDMAGVVELYAESATTPTRLPRASS